MPYNPQIWIDYRHYTPIVGTGWRHVALVRDSEVDMLRFYVDGELIHSEADEGHNISLVNNQPLQIGGDTNGMDLVEEKLNTLMEILITFVFQMFQDMIQKVLRLKQIFKQIKIL